MARLRSVGDLWVALRTGPPADLQAALVRFRVEPGSLSKYFEGRHGFAGASRAARGAWGARFEAPHVG